MKSRPIIFSGPMIRAILDGTKTQTRRVLVKQPLDIIPMNGKLTGIEWVGLTKRPPDAKGLVFRCRLGVPGDRLWVRERADYIDRGDGVGGVPTVVYLADEQERRIPKEHVDDFERPVRRPSIFMPRWASRLSLEIVKVRAQRLTAISQRDALAEGTQGKHSYAALWDSLNAKRGFGWDTNPWVWAIEFRRVT